MASLYFDAYHDSAMENHGSRGLKSQKMDWTMAVVSIYLSSYSDGLSYSWASARETTNISAKYASIELPPDLSVGPEYGLTVARQALPAASEFALYQLSPQGQASVKAFGFIPVTLPAASQHEQTTYRPYGTDEDVSGFCRSAQTLNA